MDVREYLTSDGRNPYREWLDTLDVAPRGPHSGEGASFFDREPRRPQTVGRGVWEARVIFGPGYRIYFGKDGAHLVLLLLDGDRSTQTADVRRAQEFWKACQEGKRRGTTK